MNGFKEKILVILTTAALTGIGAWATFAKDVATKQDVAAINTRIDNLVIAVGALTNR